MLEHNAREGSPATPPRAELIPLIQFYSIQLSALADGGVSLGITATLCEDEGDLIGMDVASARVENLSDALAVIGNAVAFAPSPLQ